MRRTLRSLTREALFRSPLRKYFFPRWQLVNMNAAQLCFLSECVERTRDVPGALVEIGCAAGITTIWLNKYMDARKIEKPYITVDTFAGFVPEDVDFEVANRRKRTSDYHDEFTSNKQRWFDGTMEMNGIRRVKSIKADANTFDYASLGAVSFCLLDVDLYRPMKHALPLLFRQLSPGGLIVVDDCNTANPRWDGSYQAYMEFMKDLGEEPRIVHDKLGVISKDS